jgi:hypothetical protein
LSLGEERREEREREREGDFFFAFVHKLRS